jgi:hypothetical protein
VHIFFLVVLDVDVNEDVLRLLNKVVLKIYPLCCIPIEWFFQCLLHDLRDDLLLSLVFLGVKLLDQRFFHALLLFLERLLGIIILLISDAFRDVWSLVIVSFFWLLLLINI